MSDNQGAPASDRATAQHPFFSCDVFDMGGMVISANVVQFPTPGEMEWHLLELLAKVRAGEVTYLATTRVGLGGVIEQREIDEFVWSPDICRF